MKHGRTLPRCVIIYPVENSCIHANLSVAKGSLLVGELSCRIPSTPFEKLLRRFSNLQEAQWNLKEFPVAVYGNGEMAYAHLSH